MKNEKCRFWKEKEAERAAYLIRLRVNLNLRFNLTLSRIKQLS